MCADSLGKLGRDSAIPTSQSSGYPEIQLFTGERKLIKNKVFSMNEKELDGNDPPSSNTRGFSQYPPDQGMSFFH
jgi:hypothetical protein